MKKLLFMLFPLFLAGCAKNIDLKRPEFTKSPCACIKLEWREKEAQEDA